MNNIELIKPLLTFETLDVFYHLQILLRKKDNPNVQGSNNNARCIKTYYITSIEYLELKMPEIILLCDFNNARACINLNKRSFENIAFHTLQKITNCILNKDYKSIRKAYEHSCGSFTTDKNKKWMIDIDTKDEYYICSFENYLYEHKVPIITKIPTKNGLHYITSPFNTTMINIKEDIHKNNPTLLYWKD